MKKSGSNTEDLSRSWIPAGFLLALSWLLSGLSLQSICEQPQLALAFFSPTSWEWGVLHLFGGEVSRDASGQVIVVASFVRCLLATGLLLGGLILVAMLSLKFRTEELAAFVKKIAGWWLIFGCWGIFWLFALINQSILMGEILQATLVFWVSVTIAGSLYELTNLFRTDPWIKSDDTLKVSTKTQKVNPSWKQHLPIFAAIGVFVLCFSAMNGGLWFNLRLPHGDSAMYEEHLWNITHGKGFRSYLDQGLFWGEHIQFVHLFLLPLYWLWPSHLLLEFCESFALALGAIPVYWMTFRSSQSQRAATLVSSAYLLYFPLQFLDISIDLKTFRPISFGVPIVLFALDQLERKRFGTAAALLLLSLSCKEDYAIVVFSIGLALLTHSGWNWFQGRLKAKQNDQNSSHKKESLFGAAFFVLGPIYLLFALNLIRSFRSGVEVHYAGYFSKFGKSTGEIIWNMLTDPGLLIGELLTVNALVYALALLVPLGFLPLCSGWRGISCLPMFVLLCLNELSQTPMHHFHAPLLPLLFWTLAAGFSHTNPLSKFITTIRTRRKTNPFTEKVLVSEDSQHKTEQHKIERRGWWVVSSALATSMWFSLSPLGVPFWDSGSSWNGAKLYFPDERAKMFENIKDQIPISARVASTDFIHPRFTHYSRSYDYSHYARKVSGYKLSVPEDTDYIVIDTKHPYSTITHPEEVREYRESPEQWKLLPDRTNGYFLVFKRQR